MRELFVYYRVRAADAAATLAAVRAFQAEVLADAPALVARLLRRPGEADGVQTWMETYSTDPERSPHGVSADLQARIESRALTLAPHLDGPRHAEVFTLLTDSS